MIYVAYEVRNEKSRLLAEAAAAEAAEEVEDTPPENTNVSPRVIRVLLNPNTITILPSSILKDTSKVDCCVRIFDPDDKWKRVDMVSLSDSERSNLLKKADTLFALFQSRLQHHIVHRVDPSQHDNRCLHWAAKNFAIVAAYMVLFDHLKIRIQGQDASKCLLRNPEHGNKFLEPANGIQYHFGCYLHHDPEIEATIRSGSSAGEGGFAHRLDTHLKKAKAARNDDESRLYGHYPSVHSVRARDDETTYEDLMVFIAASFNPVTVSTDDLSKDYTDGGLFIYTKEEKEWIGSLSFSGRTLEQKYMQMVAYLFELGYDLAIGRTNNISDSPGFEGRVLSWTY